MRRKLLTDRKAAEEFVAKLERRDLHFFEFDNDGRKVDTTDLLVALLKNRIATMNYTLQQDRCQGRCFSEHADSSRASRA